MVLSLDVLLVGIFVEIEKRVIVHDDLIITFSLHLHGVCKRIFRQCHLFDLLNVRGHEALNRLRASVSRRVRRRAPRTAERTSQFPPVVPHSELVCDSPSSVRRLRPSNTAYKRPFFRHQRRPLLRTRLDKGHAPATPVTRPVIHPASKSLTFPASSQPPDVRAYTPDTLNTRTQFPSVTEQSLPRALRRRGPRCISCTQHVCAAGGYRCQG